MLLKDQVSRMPPGPERDALSSKETEYVSLSHSVRWSPPLAHCIAVARRKSTPPGRALADTQTAWLPSSVRHFRRRPWRRPLRRRCWGSIRCAIRSLCLWLTGPVRVSPPTRREPQFYLRPQQHWCPRQWRCSNPDKVSKLLEQGLVCLLAHALPCHHRPLPRTGHASSHTSMVYRFPHGMC